MEQTTWKMVAASSLGLIGSVLWAAARVSPMTFEDAKTKADALIDEEASETKKAAKNSKLPVYVQDMLTRLRDNVASAIWDAYDRGKAVGKDEGAAEVAEEFRAFLTAQADMAEQRHSQSPKEGWNLVAREFRAACKVLGDR